MDDKPPKSSSSKKVILIVLAVVIVGGVAAAYFINKNNEEEKEQKAAQASQTAQNVANTTNTLNAASTAGKSFVATINTTTTGGQPVTGVMTSDGKGNVSYVYKADGKDVSLIYTADAYYLCNGTATCIKYPASQTSSSGFNPSDYQYDGSKINALKSTAAYKGQQACPSPSTGTCDVWSVTEADTTTTMYVNSADKQIAKVTTKSGTTTSDITYEYKAVTVAAPANSVTLPTGQ